MDKYFFEELNNNIDEIKTHLSTKVKSNTINTYYVSLNNIKRSLNNDYLIKDIINDKNYLVDIIKNFINNYKGKESSKSTLLNGFRQILIGYNEILHLKNSTLNFDSLILELLSYFKSETRKISSAKIYQAPTSSELENLISMDDIINLRENTKRLCEYEFFSNYRRHLRYLILCLYTYIPPLRGEDFFTSKVYDNVNDVEETQKNYVLISENLLIINEYKTIDKYGTRKIKLPRELINVITHFKLTFNTNWLIPKLLKFPKNIHEHMDGKNFTPFMYSIFGKKIASSMIRKIYISENIDKLNGDERKKIALIMAHHPSTAVLTYTRFNFNIHKNQIDYENLDESEN